MAKKKYYQDRRSGKFNPRTGMMGENPAAMANMPREAVLQMFEELPHYNSYMDDTIARVSDQVRGDVSKLKKNVSLPYRD